MQRPHDPGSEIVSGPFHTQMLALQIEVSNLLQGIESAQLRIELHAIDDDHFITDPNVLRPQVAVSVDDTPLL